MSAPLEVAVIGAGPAGLWAAHALTCPKFHRGPLPKVTVFEAHSKPGGSASYFRRKFLPETYASFDAGATVLNAISEGAFLQRLCRLYGVHHTTFASSPRVHFYLENHRPQHFSLEIGSGDSFVRDLAKNFPDDAEWLLRELPPLFRLTQNLQATLQALPILPLESPLDVWHNLRALRFAPRELWRLGQLLDIKFGQWLQDQRASAALCEWIDMNCLITLQCRASEVWLPWGLMALFFYPLGIGTAVGGMKALFDELLLRLSERATVKTREEVQTLLPTASGWMIQSTRGRYGPFAKVFSSAPRYNTEKLLGQHFSPPDLRYENLKADLWTALVGYFVVSDHPELSPESFNLHTRSLGGHEVYFSFSLRGDELRAPKGYRVVTGSTHWPVDRHFSESHYREEKQRAGQEGIKAPLLAALPELQFHHEEYAGQKTFRRYTRRLDGTVGGMALNTRHTLWKSASLRTPLEGLYQIGDTSFPGQSIYSCAIGALIACREAVPGFHFALD